MGFVLYSNIFLGSIFLYFLPQESLTYIHPANKLLTNTALRISQDICYVRIPDNTVVLTIYGHQANLFNNNRGWNQPTTYNNTGNIFIKWRTRFNSTMSIKVTKQKGTRLNCIGCSTTKIRSLNMLFRYKQYFSILLYCANSEKVPSTRTTLTRRIEQYKLNN